VSDDFKIRPSTLEGDVAFDGLGLEETAMRAAEEREVKNLIEHAGTKRETTVSEFDVDMLRECIHRLQHAGFASRRLPYDELYSDDATDEDGALFLVSAAPLSDGVPSIFNVIKRQLQQMSQLSPGEYTHGETYEIDGYLVEPMHHAPAGVVLFVDVAALARHPTVDGRTLIREPNGIAVVEVDADAE
jgi:hypothetical protein